VVVHMSFKDLLALLADGEFHSGEELGQALGVSRAAVWKQLQKLAEVGLELESVKGRGYRLPGGFHPLDASIISSHLDKSAAELLTSLDISQQTESTSTDLGARARLGAGSGAVCVAEQQTVGRGRLGRQWLSSYGRNLMFSALWEFEGGAAALEGLSLAVGLVLAEALCEMGVAEVQLKWPNDVLCRGRKVAGILLEMQGDAAGHCQVVIGVGVNVAMPDNAAIDQAWTDLNRETGSNVDRNALLAQILGRLLPMLNHFADVGFSAYRERWQSLDFLCDRAVILHRGEQKTEGVCRGVASSGALKFEGADGLELISGGEVSVRAAHDS
jgi:BirA family biotin operon repressor/biotin-[acetyl-CoA-carboxylase] ligase